VEVSDKENLSCHCPQQRSFSKCTALVRCLKIFDELLYRLVTNCVMEKLPHNSFLPQDASAWNNIETRVFDRSLVIIP